MASRRDEENTSMATVTFDKVVKRYGDFTAVKDLDLAIQDGEFMVLVGPSGCGKTTSLRMIAGLESITSGTLRIGDRVVNDVAPKDRDIAMVFQSYALYPHMTVRDNMSFGLKLKKTPKAEIERRVKETAGILGLDALLERKPAALSGGQRQRVALGRAIVREPSVFLMDEPLSNLDAKLRVETRANIARLHQRLGTTTVYVTHDQVEAMTMGTRIAVMNVGQLQQVGPPQQLYEHPNNLFVAQFIGSPAMNVADVTATDSKIQGAGFELPVPPAYGKLDSGRQLVVGYRPEHLELGEIPNATTIRAKADVVEFLGDDELLHLTVQGHDGDVVAVVSSSFRVKPGDVLDLKLPLDRLQLFDKSTGAALAPAGSEAATTVPA